MTTYAYVLYDSDGIVYYYIMYVFFYHVVYVLLKAVDMCQSGQKLFLCFVLFLLH